MRWSATATRSFAEGTNWSEAKANQRVHEYVVEPNVLQNLPEHHAERSQLSVEAVGRALYALEPWNRGRLLHKHGLTVARAVAAGESPPRRLHPGVRDRVLKLLRDAGVLEHEARGRWRVIDPLLRHYLAALDPFGPQ
jgi:hypothetical protein